MYKFCGNRGNFLNYVKIGGICNVHRLRGMDASDSMYALITGFICMENREGKMADPST